MGGVRGEERSQPKSPESRKREEDFFVGPLFGEAVVQGGQREA